MNQIPEYEFNDKTLYTEVAVNYLEQVGDELEPGYFSEKEIDDSISMVIAGELESLHRYLEELEPYNTTLNQAYSDEESIPRPEVVLGRIEEDMDMMARERDSKLDEAISPALKRREFLDRLLEPLQSDRPVLADTWIIMNEASELREFL